MAQPSLYEDSLARASQMSQFGGAPARSQYNTALRRVRETQFPDMTDEQWAEYSGMVLAPYDRTDLVQQSQTFGFGDEIGAGIAAFGSGAREMVGGGGPGFDGAYDASYELEQARLNYGRQREGGLGLAAEILGGAVMGPARAAMTAVPSAVQSGSRFVNAAKAAIPLAAEGGVYGFGSTDGDLNARLRGAGIGATASIAGGAAAPAIAKVIQGTARRVAQIPVNIANRQAIRQAVRSAPSAATIKATSQAAYKAADATGAVLSQPAMQILSHDVDQLARVSGLVMPDGSLSSAFPKAAHAVQALRLYAQGPATVAEAQTLLKTLRAVQKSADPAEAGLGNMMVNQLDDFMDSLPPAAFARNGQNGAEATRQWAKGRTEWARSKRTQAIEDIVADARLAKGGFASGLRSGFASMLKSKNAKKRRGFSADELAAIERFVAGGPIQELLERLGGGAGLPGGLLGGMAGGPIGAIGVPAAGMAARRLTDGNARRVAEQLRARVALPGGIPQQTLPPASPILSPSGLRMIGGQVSSRGSQPHALSPRDQVAQALLAQQFGG